MSRETTTGAESVLPTADGLPENARRLAVFSLAIGVAMASLDTAIANVALPAIAEQLNTTPASSVWIINVYQLAMVATLLPFAALGEIICYRRVLLWTSFIHDCFLRLRTCLVIAITGHRSSSPRGRS